MTDAFTDPPLSSCCSATITVTREVHDLLDYRPQRWDGDTLVVSGGTFVEQLDSCGYVAVCDGCEALLEVKVSEG